MDKNQKKIMQEIYLIPSSLNDGCLVYAPLKKVLFWANPEASNLIREYIYSGKDISAEHVKLNENINKMLRKKSINPSKQSKLKISNKVVFLLSQKCNLACSYCYAQNSRSQDTLSKSSIITMVTHILSLPNNKVKEFVFIGGGEPTVTWNLFVWTVEYIKKASVNQKIRISLTTNGTLLNKKRVEWLSINKIRVGISFDILPHIQDAQRSFPDGTRSSFESVNKGIRILEDYGMFPRLRSTITKDYVQLMPEMVEFVKENYPNINGLHFEHVSELGLTYENYYDSFITQFFKAKQIGNNYGIEIRNSIISSTNYIKSSFCSGEFCITPSSEIVSCHRVSNSNDSLFKCFNYGFVDNKVNLDLEMIRTIEENTNNKHLDCNDCFAKWHCAGGCPYNNSLYPEEQLDILCRFTKNMISMELESKIIK